MDFELARENMVHSQVRPSDVTDKRISTAMLNIRRELFVPAGRESLAYSDEDIRLETSSDYPFARFMMDPMHLSKLVQLASISQGDVVLEIGCGTGYSTALISRLCESVIAIEEDAKLVEKANTLLSEEGFDNSAVVKNPLCIGLAEQGPYDVIVISGLVEDVPPVILDQLKEGGRLVAYVGDGRTAFAMVYKRGANGFSATRHFSGVVPTLPGFAKKPEFQF